MRHCVKNKFAFRALFNCLFLLLPREIDAQDENLLCPTRKKSKCWTQPYRGVHVTTKQAKQSTRKHKTSIKTDKIRRKKSHKKMKLKNCAQEQLSQLWSRRKSGKRSEKVDEQWKSAIGDIMIVPIGPDRWKKGLNPSLSPSLLVETGKALPSQISDERERVIVKNRQQLGTN